MSFYVLVRGPLGVGKSTVSKRLARVLRAEYISVDRILDDEEIWYSGRLSEFLKANEILAARAGPIMATGRPVVLDGNFYWKTQIRDLEQRLDRPHHVFTLRAPLTTCAERDAGRIRPHGAQAAREVYAKSTKFEYGIGVDATQPLARIVEEIEARIARSTPPRPGVSRPGLGVARPERANR
jgi:predicted kinase